MTPYRQTETIRSNPLPPRELAVPLEAPTLLETIFRRAPKPSALLRVEDNVLTITFADRREVVRARLDDVMTVQLETKTIDKGHVQLGPDGRIAVGYMELSVDMSRLELVVGEDREARALTKGRIPHEVAMVWLGKIRVFLRSHAWLPEDERAEAVSSRRITGPE